MKFSVEIPQDPLYNISVRIEGLPFGISEAHITDTENTRNPLPKRRQRKLSFSSKHRKEPEMNPNKKRNTVFLSLILALCLSISLLCGCRKENLGEPVMTLGDDELTANMFMLFLARAKGGVAFSLSDARNDSFWDMLISEEGKTYADYYHELVIESSKTILAAVNMFHEMGLKLPDSKIAKIDEELEKLMRNASDGGTKNEFNAVLAEYGANYNILRKVYIYEAMVSAVQEELFGKDASKVSSLLKQEYMENNYVRFKHIFIYTVKARQETDENGTVIYYDAESKKYLYEYSDDTDTKLDEKGELICDKFGTPIRYYKDGTVAYDKKNGITSSLKDKDGNTIVDKLTGDELKERREFAERIKNELYENMSDSAFDALVNAYSEDDVFKEYPNGVYLTAYSNYDPVSVRDELFKMEIGEYKTVESDYGIHIVRKYALDEGAFSASANESFFKDFNTEVSDYLFSVRIESYVDKIVLDEERLNKLNIKDVAPDFYY